MKRPKNGSTLKQVAYARKLFNANGKNKTDIALSVGYSPAMAKNAHAKIEKSEGFLNAMHLMAVESNNLVMAAMAEYKKRGLASFSNSELNSAMNAIGAAWERINKQRAPEDTTKSKNPLKALVLQQVENQTVVHNHGPQEAATASSAPDATMVEPAIDLDF